MSSQDDDDVIGFIAGAVETMRDQMATKGDIGRLSDRLETATTAIRGDIEQVHLRLSRFICGSRASNILCRLDSNKSKAI